MTPVVLVIIAALWAVYLGQWLRHRRQDRGVNSISSFSKHLSVLERTSPIRPERHALSARTGAGRPTPIFPAANYTPPRPPMSLADARRRRRTVLYTLAAAGIGSLVLIPFVGTPMVVFHIVTDVALVGYLGLLVRTRRLADERRAKVRYLPTASRPEPQLALQRTANY